MRLSSAIEVAIVVLSLCASALSCNKTARVGDDVIINCSNTMAAVQMADWTFKPNSSSKPELEICTGIACKQRYHVERGRNFQLTIYGVQLHDSGRYTCVAMDSMYQHRHSTELCITDERRPLVGQQQTLDSTQIYTSTRSAITQQPQSIDTQVIAVVIALTIIACLMLTALVVVAYCIIARRQKRKRYTMLKLHNGEKQLQTARQTNKQTETVSIEQLVSEKFNGRILDASFILLFRRQFRQSNDNGCYESSVEYAFTTLAASSASWRKVLTEINALKHRLIGRLYYERSGYVFMRPTPVDVQLPVSVTSPVIGVAVFGGVIYVIFEELCAICVINGDKKMVVVKGMQSPVDIIACPAVQKLYVADKRSRCIWQVQIETCEPMEWIAFKEATPKTMSIRDSSLVVTTDTPVLFKYSQTGELITEVNLGDSTEVLHAVETSRSTIIACCMRPRGHQIVEFKLNGQEYRKFICEPRMMRFPSYLAQHSDGRLLVADSGSSRVFLIDSRLKHGCTTIINQQSDKIAKPHRLCIDEEEGQLFIVHLSAHSVQRFAVTVPNRARH